ncbi:MAG: hypothetical protein IJM62_03120 [Lachnospiraceae bacterium]|nr:hypothetical protein [Lachnospiraceae bacterium]
MSRATAKITGTDYYVPGNAVPVPEIERPGKVLTKEELERRREQKAQAERNKERVMRIDVTFMLLLVGVSVLLFLSCMFYLKKSALLSEKSRHVAAMEVELNEITDANIAARERIDSTIDLEMVYTVATTKLGMKYADASQIIYYKSTGGDYVKQYQPIPAD